MFFEETPWFPPGYQLSRSHPLSTPIFNPTAFHKRNERIMAPTVTPRRSTRNKTVSEATVKKVDKMTKSTRNQESRNYQEDSNNQESHNYQGEANYQEATHQDPPPQRPNSRPLRLPKRDDTFTHPLAPKSTLPTNNNITHGQSQTATPKKMFPYLYPPLEPDYEPKWQPMWGTWPTAPKQGPKACTFDKYYYFSFLGDAPRAQRALESLCKTLEESGFGGDVEKANKPLFDARDVLREWTEWRDSIPPDEYSY
ncbi:unnamed protein product [Zymoseptoria tritici ST99CH_1E4]|uniref:Uncharacterized protein n=1 Tax=Zymoseptoria tritici ST99CH_1E4 TaxID=1276532 RepID=A0A2H1H0H6_ZYMTR|nr:unnamed protein product [Zymoseptoria tritici ST99CH_1E4]